MDDWIALLKALGPEIQALGAILATGIGVFCGWVLRRSNDQAKKANDNASAANNRAKAAEADANSERIRADLSEALSKRVTDLYDQVEALRERSDQERVEAFRREAVLREKTLLAEAQAERLSRQNAQQEARIAQLEKRVEESEADRVDLRKKLEDCQSKWVAAEAAERSKS